MYLTYEIEIMQLDIGSVVFVYGAESRMYSLYMPWYDPSSAHFNAQYIRPLSI